MRPKIAEYLRKDICDRPHTWNIIWSVPRLTASDIGFCLSLKENTTNAA